MIVLAGIVLGAVFGIRAARKRGGNRLDMAQYGGVYAIIFGLVGLLVTILIDRLA